MGGGTSTGWAGSTGPDTLYDAKANPNLETAIEILNAEGREELAESLAQYEGNAGTEVSLSVDNDGSYKITVQEKLVEGDDFFSRMANYLHGNRETFEGDLEPWYSGHGQDEVLE